MYIPKTLQEESVHNNCLMGLIFWTNWGPDQKKSCRNGDFEFFLSGPQKFANF